MTDTAMTDMPNEPDQRTAPRSWDSVTTSLAVTAADLDADLVRRTLGIAPGADSHESAVIHAGPGWWSCTFDSGFSDRPDRQIAAMVSLVTPVLDGLRSLTERGYSAQIAIAGVVLSRTRLTLPPESTAQLASLGLPVSVTTLNEDNEPAPDPLDWLD
ncbi:hypothetical protein [Streptomyces sp. NPDC005805]|uniref:hypothetical protein n=1 Tax=Streptomyces sp. NPDC005805 TaxID=3157068 RepID=UPI0033D2433D